MDVSTHLELGKKFLQEGQLSEALMHYSAACGKGTRKGLQNQDWYKAMKLLARLGMFATVKQNCGVDVQIVVNVKSEKLLRSLDIL